jgi:hypothetical protein
MSDTSKEMEKQLGLYADTITGFATAQLLAFTYLMAQGGCFTKNVLNTISLPIVIGIGVNVIYWRLVRWCHRALGRISKATQARKTKEATATGAETPTEAEEDVAVQGIVRSVQTARCWIIGADLAMTLIVLGLIRLGVCLGQFCFDCKK